jgi:hypothetical protein
VTPLPLIKLSYLTTPHGFCLDSSTPECRNQGLLETPFAINI